MKAAFLALPVPPSCSQGWHCHGGKLSFASALLRSGGGGEMTQLLSPPASCRAGTEPSLALQHVEVVVCGVLRRVAASRLGELFSPGGFPARSVPLVITSWCWSTASPLPPCSPTEVCPCALHTNGYSQGCSCPCALLHRSEALCGKDTAATACPGVRVCGHTGQGRTVGVGGSGCCGAAPLLSPQPCAAGRLSHNHVGSLQPI